VRECLEPLGISYEIVFVDDGSTDGTWANLVEQRKMDSRLQVLALSRNFGKEAALTCAIDHCRGRAVIPIDVDLQEPPELIPEMVARWKEGAEMVVAKRSSRSADGFLKRFTARSFYHVFNFISETKLPYDVGDYRLMDRKVVDSFRQLREKNRFMKGLFAWLGFKLVYVHFERQMREKGTSKFPPLRLLGFAVHALFSFSNKPIRLFSYLGGLISLFAFSYGSFLVLRTIIFGIDVPGYASLMVVTLFLGGVQLVGLGVLGEYVAHIYTESKGRPIYLIRERFDYTVVAVQEGKEFI
jgi:polyisoprenyl-phosphate glycosyltransferase